MSEFVTDMNIMFTAVGTGTGNAIQIVSSGVRAFWGVEGRGMGIVGVWAWAWDGVLGVFDGVCNILILLLVFMKRFR